MSKMSFEIKGIDVDLSYDTGIIRAVEVLREEKDNLGKIESEIDVWIDKAKPVSVKNTDKIITDFFLELSYQSRRPFHFLGLDVPLEEGHKASIIYADFNKTDWWYQVILINHNLNSFYIVNDILRIAKDCLVNRKRLFWFTSVLPILLGLWFIIERLTHGLNYFTDHLYSTFFGLFVIYVACGISPYFILVNRYAKKAGILLEEKLNEIASQFKPNFN